MTPVIVDGVCTGLSVRGASAVTVLFTSASNYRGWKVPPDPDDSEPSARCERALEDAAPLGWEALRARHIADYQALFKRVTLRLGDEVEDTRPTAERLEAYREGQLDVALENLYFQYGRYLLIACSRPGGQAANLQGIWNPQVQPP